MSDVDVFNGDADGICALLQLRLQEPRTSRLVTGPKRDIELLRRLDAAPGDRITVLDVSFDKNRDDVNRLLAQGAELLYIDHHFAGDIPEHERLSIIVNEAPDVCTSLLVNGRLGGAFTHWAVVGAFGDNLNQSAERIAAPLGLSREELSTLERLGNCLNYNGYGEALSDLIFSPADLYEVAVLYRSPLDFVADEPRYFQTLDEAFVGDREKVESQPFVTSQTSDGRILMLPNAPWARRISGVYGNELANQSPNSAHAVVTLKDNGNYVVSVRAPMTRKKGADSLCRTFATGGGRAAAAGINDLPPSELHRFETAFFSHAWG